MANLPNILTLLRIILIPFIFATIYIDAIWGHWLCGVLFGIAGISDYFDGYYARKLNVVSPLGKLLDPIADKLLVTAVILILIADGRIDNSGLIPSIIIVCREIMVSGYREYLSRLKVDLPVTKLAKWKTTFQMTALPVLILGSDAVPYFSELGEIFLWIAAYFTLVTGYKYHMKTINHINNKKA